MAEILVGSVGVKLVPNAEGFRERTNTALSGISVDVGLDLDDTLARVELEELTRPRSATINADADTALAEAKLDAVARDRHVGLGVGGLGVAAAGMSGLLASAIALGPALIPVVAAVGGLAVALSAPLAAAAGGLTIFGFIAGAAVKRASEQEKNLDKLRQQLGGLTKGTAEYAKVQQQIKLQQDAISPQAAKFGDALDRLKGSFQSLTNQAGASIFGPLITGMNILTDLLPHIAPLLNTVAGAMTQVLHSLAGSGALDSFIGFLTAFAGPAIVTGAKILGNFAVGIGGLIAAAAPLGTSLGDGLTGLSESFANFGKNADSNGFQTFLNYIRDVGPTVASTIGDIVKAAVDIGKALAPLGGVLLVIVDVFAKVIDNTPGPILAVLAGLVIGLISPLGDVGVALLAIGAGLTYAYKHSETFRGIVDSLWHDFLVPFGHFLSGPFLGFLKAVGIGFLTQASVGITAFRGLLAVALGVLSAILHGADAAFGWVPVIGPKIHGAAAGFDGFKDAVLGNLDKVNGKIQDTIDKLAGIKSPPVVNVDIHVNEYRKVIGPHMPDAYDPTLAGLLPGAGTSSGGGGGGHHHHSGGAPSGPAKPQGTTKPGAAERAYLRRTQRAGERAMERGTAAGARAGISDRNTLLSARRRA